MSFDLRCSVTQRDQDRGNGWRRHIEQSKGLISQSVGTSNTSEYEWGMVYSQRPRLTQGQRVAKMLRMGIVDMHTNRHLPRL